MHVGALKVGVARLLLVARGLEQLLHVIRVPCAGVQAPHNGGRHSSLEKHAELVFRPAHPLPEPAYARAFGR